MALRGSSGDVQRTHPWDLCLARVYLDSGRGPCSQWPFAHWNWVHVRCPRQAVTSGCEEEMAPKPPGFIWTVRPPYLAPYHAEYTTHKGAPRQVSSSKSPCSMRLQGSNVGCRLQCLPALFLLPGNGTAGTGFLGCL